MTQDSRGYSARIIKANKAANANLPGVKLGRLCIAKEISVTHVAEYFKVSRMTVYNWFKGGAVRSYHLAAIKTVITSLEKDSTLD